MDVSATTATGATPGEGATPEQAGRSSETTPPAGATPPAGTTAPAAATPSATDDDPALGDAGKRILAEARRQARAAEERAKAAEAERDALRTATQTDTEKAIAAARKEAEVDTTARFESRIRRSEVRAALTAAGITASELDLATSATEFAGLKVTEAGVDGLADAIASFKAAHQALFAKPAAAVASAGGGVRGGSTPSLAAQIAEAEAAGDIRLAISLKNRQIAAAVSRKGT